MQKLCCYHTNLTITYENKVMGQKKEKLKNPDLDFLFSCCFVAWATTQHKPCYQINVYS